MWYILLILLLSPSEKFSIESFRYYSYASTGDLDLDISDLQKHINEDRFEMLYLYKTPLSEFQWTNAIFFHVYVIFYTNTPEGGFWWSLEKTGESLILQMSRDIEDVKDRLEGEERVSEASSWYWEPQFIIRDSSWETFETLYKFIIVDTDQLNISYNFAEENCKTFAKIVFDRIATNKSWNYII